MKENEGLYFRKAVKTEENGMMVIFFFKRVLEENVR